MLMQTMAGTNNPLGSAAMVGFIRPARLLIVKGAAVNMKDHVRWTALFIAVVSKYVAILQAYIKDLPI